MDRRICGLGWEGLGWEGGGWNETWLVVAGGGC